MDLREGETTPMDLLERGSNFDKESNEGDKPLEDTPEIVAEEDVE